MSQSPDERPPVSHDQAHASRLSQGLVIGAIMVLIVISLVSLH